MSGAELGFRCQVSGPRGVAQVPSRRAGDLRLFKVSRQESGIGMKSICLPLSPFRLLPYAFYLLLSTFYLLPSAF